MRNKWQTASSRLTLSRQLTRNFTFWRQLVALRGFTMLKSFSGGMKFRCMLLVAIMCSLCGDSHGWHVVSPPTGRMQNQRSINVCRTWATPRRPRSVGRKATTMMSRASSFRAGGVSKRQARYSQLVVSELAQILRQGKGIRTKDKITDDILSKITVVDVDISPDLRSANVIISVYGDVLQKREAYAWCVKNTKAIRMALAANLKGMKRVPELYFRDTDIGAAVDLMALIERVTKEDEENAMARGDAMPGFAEDDSFTFDFNDVEYGIDG